MLNQSNNLFKKIVLFSLILSVCLLANNNLLSAETSTVSQAAEITLAWDPVEPVPDGYRLYQRKEGQSYDYSDPCWIGTVTTGTVYNLDWDSTYYFVVRAYVGDQESANSNEVTFLSGPPPTTPPASYTITLITGENGVISPSNMVSVDIGSDQTFTITPNTGYHVSDVKVDGVSVGSVLSYTFNQVSANHTLEATFFIDSYTITSSAGANGAITPEGTIAVNHGSSASYSITPESGHHVADVLVDGISVGAVSSYRFDQVVAGHAIHAVFEADTFTIISTAGTNGTISPSGSLNLQIGSNQTFTIRPNEGYVISDVLVDGISMGDIDTYTFSNITTNQTISASFAAENQPPTADAGPDQVVEEGRTVLLSGLNSIDPDDGIASFQWLQIQGDQVPLNSPNEPETTFTTPNVDISGTALVFQLSVTDYNGAASVDSCIVNVTWVNVAPIADSGVDQTVIEGSEVVLNASNSVDGDDGIVSYRWNQLLGPVVALSNANSSTPTFQAPDVGTEGVSMTFEVTVTDSGGLQDTDTCLVNVSWVNNPPLADAGLDQDVNVGEEVFLDGSQSADPDGETIVSFHWHQTEGTPVELFDPTSQQPMFLAPDMGTEGGSLGFELTVTDSEGLQGNDTCKVNVAASTPDTDTTNPTITIDDPVGDSLSVTRPRVSFSGTAWDDRSVTQVNWENSAGGNGVAEGTDFWLIKRIKLKRGKNVITVTAIDSSGNQGAISKIVYFGK